MRFGKFSSILLLLVIIACRSNHENETLWSVKSETSMLELSTQILPQAIAARGETDPFLIKVRIENFGPDELIVHVAATCREGFAFISLGEAGQEIDSEGKQVRQNLILEPKFDENSSFKEIAFGFVQQGEVARYNDP